MWFLIFDVDDRPSVHNGACPPADAEAFQHLQTGTSGQAIGLLHSDRSAQFIGMAD